MSEGHNRQTTAADKRRRAEDLFEHQKPAGTSVQPGDSPDTVRLVHELDVHQIELEMQNEELLATRDQLAALLASYTDLYDFAPTSYLVLDQKGVIRRVNLAGAGLLGVDRANLLDRRFGQFVADTDRQAFNDFFEKLLTTDAHQSVEVPLSRKSAVPRIVRIEGTVPKDGKEVRLVLLDITEHRSAQAELQLRDRAISASREGICITAGPDSDGALLYVNEGFERLTGYTKEEVAGRNMRFLQGPETDPGVVRQMREAVENGRGFAGDVMNYRKDGTPFWNRLSISPVRDERGSVSQFVSVSSDVTARRQAQQRLRMLSQELITARELERTRVAADLHHDAGSLAVGFAAHLDAVEAAVRGDRREDALEWTGRMRRLFTETVTRLKKLATQIRPPDLDALGLTAALRQHFTQITETGEVRIDFTESLGRRPLPSTATTLLFRVAQEALTNAIAHGRAKLVTVLLETPGKEVTLTVQDNGQGFDPDRENERGTSAMGLLIMREMAEAEGGTFRLGSEPGRGTTVCVRLRLPGAPPPLRKSSSARRVPRQRTTAGKGRK